MAGGVAASGVLPSKIGRHEVLGFLADGGMAEIFLGRADGRAVVIKRILPHLARQQNFVSMFVDEARIGSLVKHPNVVEVHELGQVGTDLFMVMEYLAGESVSGLLRRITSRQQRLPFALGAYIIAEACAGLHAAHTLCDEAGAPLHLVHRDISPSNVFVTYDGTVKVLDFGIATAAHRLTRTATGQVKGKFSYMSPEQCRGEELDLRSDIFSLGVVLYELTTQRRLFKRANELMVLKAVTETPIPRPSREVDAYPPALEAIIFKALARDKEERYATADELREDLLHFVVAQLGQMQPGPQLGTLMGELFTERIADKQRMLMSVRAGTDLHDVPLAEADPSFELPQVTLTPPSQVSEASVSSMSEAVTVPRRRSKRGLVIGVLAVAGIAGAAAAWLMTREPESPAVATPSVAPPPAAPISATPDAAVPRGFTLRVETDPPAATISIDGEPKGKTPVAVHFDTSTTVELEIQLAGYVKLVRKVTVERDQDLLIPLVAAPAAPPPPPVAKPATPKPKPKPKPKQPDKDPFKRYD